MTDGRGGSEGSSKAALRERFKFIAGSKELTMITQLSSDVFNCQRLLPPGNRMKIIVERQTSAYALIRKPETTTTYKVRWVRARIVATRVRVTEDVIRETNRMIGLGNPVFLPYSRTDARSFEIGVGLTYYRASALFSGSLPGKALLVLMDPNGLGSGGYDNNPMIFPAHSFGVSEVQFYVDDRAVLAKPYKPKWSIDSYLQEYQSLLKVMDLDRGDGGSCMKYETFGKDYGIFAVNLRGFEGRDRGVVSVELRFEEGLKTSVAGLLIPEFRSCIMIDSDKNVSQNDY